MQSRPIRRHHETPSRRVNPSGQVRWEARYTDRHGKRNRAGTFKLKGPCRTPVEGHWSGSRWIGCCAQHAIDAAYERESAPRPARTDTVGGYAELWPKIHPRSERTNVENAWRIGVVLAIEVEGMPLRDWHISEVRRRHALAVQAALLAQGRSAEGATGILRAMSAMTSDAVDDELCDSNPWLRLGVRLNDPRVLKQPRPKRVWSIEQMHAFAAAAAAVRDADRDEPTELERWRAVYAEPMVRVLSDCGLRLGELLPLERADLRPGWMRVRRTAHESEVQLGTKTTHHKPEDEQFRDVPLPPTLEATLHALPAQIDTHLLFPTPTGKTWRERNWRRDVWEPARKGTGIDARPQEFRASWESIMRAAGVDQADLAKYAGHSVATANSRYVRALDRSAAHVRSVIG
jgi:integrase